jgi:glycosyltransferase involved in cell wall biosynthesis
MQIQNLKDNKLYLSVVAPAFNEDETIEQVIRCWADNLEQLKFKYEIIIVNDGSTDKTHSILQDLKEEMVNLSVISYNPNRGYGYAISKAIPQARGEWVLTIDSDGQFDIRDVTKLLECQRKGQYDLVTGYRVKKHDTVFRVFADRCLNLIIRILFHLQFKDTNCALKLYRGHIFRNLRIESRGYPTPTELMIRTHQLGYKAGQVGIRHRERTAGISRIKTFQTSWHMLVFFIYLRVKLWLFKAKILNTF